MNEPLSDSAALSASPQTVDLTAKQWNLLRIALSDLRSNNDSAACRHLKTAFQVGELLLAGNVSGATENAVGGGAQDLQTRIAGAVNSLLDAIGVPRIDSFDIHRFREIALYLVGKESLDEFDDCVRWAVDYRRRVRNPRPNALFDADKLVSWLVPALSEYDECGNAKQHVSFRLFLRLRLVRYCREKGLHPKDSSLAESASALSAPSISRFLDSTIWQSEWHGLPVDRFRKLHERDLVGAP